MNAFAPEFNAVFIILRSRGPVISTRRSWTESSFAGRSTRACRDVTFSFRAAIAADASEQSKIG